MIEEIRYCSRLMKMHFNKELVMTKEDNYRGAAHRDCIITVKLNYKIPIMFHNLKNYDSRISILK